MFNTPKEKITGVFKAAGNAIKKATATAIAAPAVMKAKKQMKQDTADFKTLKTVNDYKGKPDAGDYTDPLFRARTTAKNIAYDRSQQK